MGVRVAMAVVQHLRAHDCAVWAWYTRMGPPGTFHNAPPAHTRHTAWPTLLLLLLLLVLLSLLWIGL